MPNIAPNPTAAGGQLRASPAAASLAQGDVLGPPAAGPPSSSVHPQETKPPFPSNRSKTNGIDLPDVSSGRPEFDGPPPDRLETLFRHSGWAARRARVWDALTRCGCRGARLRAFASCGANCRIEHRVGTDDIRLVGNYCHDRFCVPCGTARAARIAKSIESLITTHVCRFITLTTRHSHAPLADQITRLYSNFVLLRRRTFWKNAVDGGAAFLEVKRGERDGLWHPHLHVIATGNWMEQKKLSDEWLAVTGDSYVVHIDAIGNAEARARYVTKYVTKPADSSLFAHPESLDEIICAMKGRRLCTTFGSWRGHKLDDVDQEDDAAGGKWEDVGRLTDIMSSGQTDPDKLAWRRVILDRYPHLGPLFGCGPAPPSNVAAVATGASHR